MSHLILTIISVILSSSLVANGLKLQIKENSNFTKVNVKEILEGSPTFGIDIFKKLLTRYDSDHLFLTQTTNLMFSIAEDYPEIISIQSIGKSWENRDINMMKVNGYNQVKKVISGVSSPTKQKMAQQEAAPEQTIEQVEAQQKAEEKKQEQQQLVDDLMNPDSINLVQINSTDTDNSTLDNQTLTQIDAKEEDIASQNRPAMFMTGAHHARELMTVQMTFYTVLKMLHQALVAKDIKYQNMLAQNIYYVVPIVNVDGVNLIEQDYMKSMHIMKKRKNMSPEAAKDKNGTVCLPEDSGVDLNRNYGVDFGIGEKIQVGLNPDNKYDECADPCGECYRGPSAFSEPETRAIRDFLTANKDQIKFAYNFHTNGNMWIYPYNGRDSNDIMQRSPEAGQIFQELSDEAPFPDGMSHNGNSKDIIGERIGGDGDDWTLATLNIPSVTAELGKESQYIEEWTVKNIDEALAICETNSQYLEYTYSKIGAELGIQPVGFHKLNDKYLKVYLNVTNKGMSDMQNVLTYNPQQKSATKGAALSQLDDADVFGSFVPTIQMTSKNNIQASLVQEHNEDLRKLLMQTNKTESDPQEALVTGPDKFTLPSSMSLKKRETKTITFLVQYSKDISPLGVNFEFQYNKFATSPKDELSLAQILFNRDVE